MVSQKTPKNKKTNKTIKNKKGVKIEKPKNSSQITKIVETTLISDDELKITKEWFSQTQLVKKTTKILPGRKLK